MSAKNTAYWVTVLAIGSLLSSTAALADIPPPRLPEPPAPEKTTPPQPGNDHGATTPSDGTTPAPSDAQTKEQAARSAKEAIAKALVKRDGLIALPGGQANIAIADGFSYLDAADTRKLLIDVWGNPPDAVSNVLGAIVPRDVELIAANSWAAIITYDDDGHVADNDAVSINYDDLLKQMQTASDQENGERTKAGFEPVTIVGWAQKPSYDASGHKLYWAKHLRFGADGDTLNFAIRALGRTGVLQVNVVADMRQLDDINGQVPKLLSMVSFTEGHRYADFNASSDPLAAYGLAALVAGGVAAKAGLLKWLLAAAAASWKLIAVGIAGAGAVIARFFRALFGGKGTPAG